MIRLHPAQLLYRLPGPVRRLSARLRRLMFRLRARRRGLRLIRCRRGCAPRRARKRLGAGCMALALALTLSGCWGQRELTQLFIVTALGLDQAPEPGQIELSLQVAKTQPGSGSGGGGGQSSGKSALVLTATEGTVAACIAAINMSSSRQVFIHHDQAILVGMDLARAGIGANLDLLVRDQESRMEVPVVVISGRAEDALSAEMEQDSISGLFLNRVLDGLSAISRNNVAQLLDFTSRLLDGTTAPVATLIAVEKKGDKTQLIVSGLAVFQGDKLVGTLDTEEAEGYTWAMGNVRGSSLTAQTESGKATFDIDSLSATPEITLTEDGGVKVAVKVSAELRLTEAEGFTDIEPKNLLKHLTGIAEDAISGRILGTFEAARAMDADIYGYGQAVHRAHPKAWKAMEANWGTVFQSIAFSVDVVAKVPATGKVVQSLEMEAKK